MIDNKNIMQIALPAMAENFLQMLMGMVDGYLVASLGLVSLSGVSVAGNIITIYQAIFIALAAAISSVLARSLGAGDQKSQAYHATEAVKLTVLISFVLGLISVFFGQGILRALGTEPAVAEAGGLFLAIVGGTILLLGLMTSLGALVRTTGNPRLPMYVSLLTNLLNALFSSLFIFGLHWGIVGVALGTVLARLVGVVVLWHSLSIPFAKPSWGWDKDLLQLSLPAAGERLMMRAGDVVLIALVVGFGTEAVAGNAIGEVLTQFNYMPAFGVATATVLLVAHSLGQKKTDELDQIVRKTYRLAVGLMLPVALLVFALGRSLTHLYTHDEGAVAASLLVVLFSLLGVPFTAGTVIYTAIWQGLGNGKLPFYATAIGMWVIRIGTGYLLGIILGLGLPGIWAGTLLDNAFRWLFLATLYQRHKKTIIN
ncbi:MATE family efflux transporter [Streptococcus acidominimus]|uniref:Probable multidrug resistance protein NorM n=1 Tax=Streptococcus acidominimus TaxID=1326 RepID=A0A4Y9FK70_STRAI|nr:MATE family efflux transporter [Streptococcus acidominimus]MBF0819736.1 MATE family efflux transporter [Streptococcus acidominimus]MBF0839383.1 MATE family efflux transporter [Streptococcus acidominimus]MBF0845987.1 MATE family efflux transporter [Streptococcus danieliae]TFU29521.1 MATE family efflux transporter [Streptococcus acidominimus]